MRKNNAIFGILLLAAWMMLIVIIFQNVSMPHRPPLVVPEASRAEPAASAAQSVIEKAGLVPYEARYWGIAPQ